MLSKSGPCLVFQARIEGSTEVGDSTWDDQEDGRGVECWLSPPAQSPPHPIVFPFGGQVVVREVICGLSPRVSLRE